MWVALFKAEASADSWIELRQELRREGQLIGCDVALAEISGRSEKETEVAAFIRDLAIDYDPIRPSAVV